MPWDNQANIPIQKETKKGFDKKLMSKLVSKYGNLSYDKAILILICLSDEIFALLPESIPELKLN